MKTIKEIHPNKIRKDHLIRFLTSECGLLHFETSLIVSYLVVPTYEYECKGAIYDKEREDAKWYYDEYPSLERRMIDYTKRVVEYHQNFDFFRVYSDTKHILADLVYDEYYPENVLFFEEDEDLKCIRVFTHDIQRVGPARRLTVNNWFIIEAEVPYTCVDLY